MRNFENKAKPCARWKSAAIFVAVAVVLTGGMASAETAAKSSDKGQSDKGKTENTSALPLDNAIRLAKQSRDALDDVKDYVATFQKKERIGNRIIAHTMTLKHRREPFSVYLKFIGEHDGREVIYVDGSNAGKLQVHETGLAGLVGTISLLPTSSEAMSESVHPITDIGMWNLVERVITQWEAENKHGEVEIQYYPNARLGTKTECKVIETTHPRKRPHFKYHRTRLYIEKKTNYPARVEQYDYPTEAGAEPLLAAEYQYTEIRVNQSLGDLDFDTRNPKYGY